MIENARNHLHVTLMLHVPTHDAETQGRFVATRDKARNDGMKRSLAPGNNIGVIGIQHKARAAILHGNAGAGNNDARTKRYIVGLNKRHH